MYTRYVVLIKLNTRNKKQEGNVMVNKLSKDVSSRSTFDEVFNKEGASRTNLFLNNDCSRKENDVFNDFSFKNKKDRANFNGISNFINFAKKFINLNNSLGFVDKVILGIKQVVYSFILRMDKNVSSLCLSKKKLKELGRARAIQDIVATKFYQYLKTYKR
jgi:hypothetical protein